MHLSEISDSRYPRFYYSHCPCLIARCAITRSHLQQERQAWHGNFKLSVIEWLQETATSTAFCTVASLTFCQWQPYATDIKVLHGHRRGAALRSPRRDTAAAVPPRLCHGPLPRSTRTHQLCIAPLCIRTPVPQTRTINQTQTGGHRIATPTAACSRTRTSTFMHPCMMVTACAPPRARPDSTGTPTPLEDPPCGHTHAALICRAAARTAVLRATAALHDVATVRLGVGQSCE